jgi:hypothetical protein
MTHDPMSVPMIFLRIGWMNRYEGQTTSDQISGGGAFVEEHGFGHEMFNFQPFEGRVLGYVQPPRTAYNDRPGPGIDINRLGATSDDDSLSGAVAGTPASTTINMRSSGNTAPRWWSCWRRSRASASSTWAAVQDI